MLFKNLTLVFLTATSASLFAKADALKSATKKMEEHGKKKAMDMHIAPEISLAELKKLAESKGAVIIDANGSDSFKGGHVPGAIHYEPLEGKLATALPADKSTLIVAYCGGPMCTAWEAPAKEAMAAGYTNIKHLKVGIKGWNDAKYPVTKG